MYVNESLCDHERWSRLLLLWVWQFSLVKYVSNVKIKSDEVSQAKVKGKNKELLFLSNLVEMPWPCVRFL